MDLSHYYGEWVTPHAEAVQERIRRAVDLLPDRQIWGYQGDPDVVDRQVAALYQSLREREIAYVNSVIDYGGRVGEATQRTRLPRESIAGRAANCIDGAVLFASLLEGSSLNPALVLVPGHAFVGWEVWDGSDEWKYLETTMIGSQDFEAACKSGMKQFSDAEKFGRSRLVVHKLYDLRVRRDLADGVSDRRWHSSPGWRNPRDEERIMSDELIYFNGVDGVTGQYLVPPLSLTEAAAKARGRPTDASLKGWFGRLRDSLLGHRGLPFDIHPTDLARAGWGIVFAADTPAEVRSALEPLISHRGRQVPADRCKSLEYRPGEALRDWLKRHGVYTGNVAPLKIPYYLTLVGDPSAIPFEFQYLLDIEYAVGRLAFDRPDQYRQYAEAVVDYETAGTPPTEREVDFWGTRHPADRATQMSADCLHRAALRGCAGGRGQEAEPPIATVSQFRSRFSRADDATRANLSEIIHKRGQPVLLTASHGMGWPKGHENQLAAQARFSVRTGLASARSSHRNTWPRLTWRMTRRVHGMVAFHFACYGAGTPAVDNFLNDRGHGPIPIAEKPFIAALPQRLLSHPQGGLWR